MNVVAHYSSVANTASTTLSEEKYPPGRNGVLSGKPQGTLRLASLGSAGRRKLTGNHKRREADERFG